jgi:hypothetical protein
MRGNFDCKSKQVQARLGGFPRSMEETKGQHQKGEQRGEDREELY